MAGNHAVFETAMKRAHNHAWDEQWIEAIEQYKLATSEFPEDVAARNSLAFAYFKAKRLREALREYRKVSELRPRDPSPIRKKARILEDLGRVTDAAQARMALAQLHTKQGTLGTAIEAWQEVVRLQPASKEGHQGLAEAYVSKSNTAEAVQECLALARLYDSDGEYAKAMEYCQQALSLDGRNDEARALLGSLTSGREAGILEPSEPSRSLLRSQTLSPVDMAVQQALASLAEAVLGEEELSHLGEPATQGKDEREFLSADEMEIAAILGKAVDSHSRGMFEDALGYYEKALELGADRDEVVFCLGLLYKDVLRFGEAIDLLERSAEVPGYCLAGHFALGECHWAQGGIDKASDHFLEALKIIDLDFASQHRTDDISQSYQDLADSHELKEEDRRARSFLHSVSEFFGGSDWRLRVKEARRTLDILAEEDSTPILAEFLAVPGGQPVLGIMTKSREYLRRDMPYVALEECYRAIEMASTYLPLHVGLAEIFASQGKVEEAVSKYTAVAHAWLMRDNPRRAIEAYGRALHAAPMNVSIRERQIGLLIDYDEVDRAVEEYMALGEGYYRLARVDEALEKYDEALQLAPRTAAAKDWQVRILHTMADLHLQRVHWGRALDTYRKIRALSPEDEEAHLRSIDLCFKLGQEEVALKELDNLIAHHGREKEFQSIIEPLRELVYSNPQSIALRSRLGRIYIEAGMKEAAIAELDTLGELQLEDGLKTDAIDTLQTIIALGPKEEDGYTQLLRELGGDAR